jgi:hypothetical protein
MYHGGSGNVNFDREYPLGKQKIVSLIYKKE